MPAGTQDLAGRWERHHLTRGREERGSSDCVSHMREPCNAEARAWVPDTHRCGPKRGVSQLLGTPRIISKTTQLPCGVIPQVLI